MHVPPNPFDRVREAASLGPQSVALVTGLLPRVSALLDAAERAVARFDGLVARLERSASDLDVVIGRVAETETLARGVMVDVAVLQRRAVELADAHEPALREALPVLTTLQTVGPDLTELLAVSRALNELMGSLPGLGKAKKRVDEELAREQDAGG